ncbi:Nucleotide-binding universal stress protein, UspA family [Halopelagius inordinatus]|uniref:Nucleotide-binding universal stress protein, UspA family n=1 Tax=Halopelagius inordinatus TaxID=553467 RepID=A0A1I2VZA0_9EURY|nr:universal stress protein [Halopelagius inordinatus]SFG92621.1 Nucleotide-binding universal stress protein, UspA family [Halopelagius inordinatus]
MYHVLAAVDGNEDRVSKQLDTLRGLPGRDELEVTVLHVHEEIDVPADEAGRSVIESINEDIDSLQGVPDAVYRAAEELETLGIQTDVATMRGDPVPTILDAAEDVGADAILVAARERSPVGKAMFGSVTQGVILDSDVPVIVGN